MLFSRPAVLVLFLLAAPGANASADAGLATLSFQPRPSTDTAPRGVDPAGVPVVPDAPDPADPAWTVSIEPRVWFVAPSGDLKLASGSAPARSDSVDINELNIDSPRLSPFGAFRIASERWMFTFSGASYSIDHTQTLGSSFQLGAITFASGDQATTSLSFGIYELTAAYRFYSYDWSHDRPPASDPADRVLLSISAFAGALIQDVGVSVNRVGNTGPASEYSNVFFEPVIGIDLNFALTDQFAIDLRLAGGGLPLDETSTITFDIALAFTWQPCSTFGVQLGWRQLAFWLSDDEGADEFEFNGHLAGLFLGVTIRF